MDVTVPVAPLSKGCAECLAMGDAWVHLRACLSCGHVGCCDQSKNKHASKHYEQTGHPLIRSLEPLDDWTYCFEDEVFLT
jgi:K+:H+ antiporter